MRQRRIAKTVAAREAAHRHTSTTAAINKSASKSSTSAPVADPICLVCKRGYLLGSEESTMLSCKHFFHSDCIISWLRVENFCPVCLLKINLPRSVFGLEEEDDDDDGKKKKDVERTIDFTLEGDIIYDDDWKAMAIGYSMAFCVIVFGLLYCAYIEGVFN